MAMVMVMATAAKRRFRHLPAPEVSRFCCDFADLLGSRVAATQNHRCKASVVGLTHCPAGRREHVALRADIEIRYL
jgi:hypothetical protein